MAKNYGMLQRNRLIVAGLTLGLLTVMFGVIIDIALTGQRTTIAAPTKKLIAPLNPQLDLTVLERLEAYEPVTFEQAREGVRQARQNTLQDSLFTTVGVVDSASADGFSQVIQPDSPVTDSGTVSPESAEPQTSPEETTQ